MFGCREYSQKQSLVSGRVKCLDVGNIPKTGIGHRESEMYGCREYSQNSHWYQGECNVWMLGI